MDVLVFQEHLFASEDLVRLMLNHKDSSMLKPSIWQGALEDCHAGDMEE